MFCIQNSADLELRIQNTFIARPVHFARAISLILLRSGLSKWFTIYLFLSVNVTIPLYYIFKFKKKSEDEKRCYNEKRKNKQTRAGFYYKYERVRYMHVCFKYLASSIIVCYCCILRSAAFGAKIIISFTLGSTHVTSFQQFTCLLENITDMIE